MSLVCSDRPGLLADRWRRVLRQHRLRVHDARIATFGERSRTSSCSPTRPTPASTLPTAGKVNEWLKKAVLLYFRINDMALMGRSRAVLGQGAAALAGFDEAAFRALGARIVPGAVVRRGAHLGRDVVLMPSFVNIGAMSGEGTMVDTWATVGSCAQIGRNCHLSGGAGIGGVLEPLQARRPSSRTTASSARARKWWKA
jgi:hypothetical protein